MSALWTIAANPRRRRKVGGRKTRSAAQRAATRKMLAANRSRRSGVSANPRRRRRVVHHRAIRRNPVAKRRTSRRAARRSSGRMSMGGMKAGAFALLKAGAIGAGGALTVDVAMGFLNGYLPATMNTKLNADGTVNYLNYAVKGALAVSLAHFGKRMVSAETANRMATGSFTVMAYEILRPMVVNVMPATMSLGWFSPGRVMRPGVGNYQNKLGNYQATAMHAPARSLQSPNAVAANVHVLGR